MADGDQKQKVEIEAKSADSLPSREDIQAALAATPKSERFLNRELSWLQFNMRVLEEAENMRHPLLERLRFLSISGNNLDEFYMVRVAGLRGQTDLKIEVCSDDGLTPWQQLQQVNDLAETLMAKQQQVWAHLKEEMRDNRILVLDGDSLMTVIMNGSRVISLRTFYLY